MEIILKKNVNHLGRKDELVTVKAGYGRNYLIPQGFASLATPSLKKLWQENQSQSEHKRARELEQAQQLAQALAEINLSISTKASKQGSIYGSITALQLSEALKKKGHIVPRKDISFKEQIKTLGTHQAILRLHKDIQQEITFEVIAEERV